MEEIEGYDIVEGQCQDIDHRGLVYPGLEEDRKPVNLDYLLCPICKTPFVKPHVTKCGHTFCGDCIREALVATKYTCPLDKTLLLAEEHSGNSLIFFDKPVQVTPAPLVLKILSDDLEVLCINSKRGCQWRGMRSDLKNHAVNTCGETRVLHKGVLVRKSLFEEGKVKLTEDSELPEEETDDTVYCPNSDLGCRWVYKILQDDNQKLDQVISEHTASLCKFEKIGQRLKQQDEKLENLSRQNTQIQNKYQWIINSIPYLHENKEFVNNVDRLKCLGENPDGSDHQPQKCQLTSDESLYMKQLLVDNYQLGENITYLMASVTNLQMQLNHLAFSHKQQLLNSEKQRMQTFQHRLGSERSSSLNSSDTDLDSEHTRVKL